MAASASFLDQVDGLRTLLQQAPTGLIAAEAPSGRIIMVNEEAERILGWSPGPAASRVEPGPLGGSDADDTPDNPLEHPLARALAGADVRNASIDCQGSDALVRLCVNASPVRSSSGRILGAVTTFVDLGERPLPGHAQRADDRPRDALRSASELERLQANLIAMSAGLEDKVQLAYQAQHDFLTGLPNRVLFEERLERAVTSAERYGRRLALLFLDLDGFVTVNDTFGRDAGDRILKDVARRLQHSLRRSDTLARFGGDEFVVLVSEIKELDDASEVGLALLASLVEPFEVPGSRLTLTASVGVSIFPDDAKDAKELERHADAAMYHAQESGSNGISLFGSPDRHVLFASDRYGPS